MSNPEFKLTALETFECLASDCPDDCCSYSWDISVGDDTVEKWKALPDVALREKILSNVFDMDEHGRKVHYVSSGGRLCGMQDEQGLCIIHSSLGHDYIPVTCQKYPRNKVQHSSYQLSSASMSCPEIARLIIEHDKNRNVFDLEGTLSDVEEPASSINDFVSKVMGKSKFLLATKLLVINNFLVELSVLADRGELDLAKLHAMSRKIDKPLKEAERNIRSQRLKIEGETAGRFWSMVYRLVTKEPQYQLEEKIRNHSLIKKLAEKNLTPEYCKDLYREINVLREAATPAMQKLMQGVGERYLEAKFKSIGFPLAPLADNYVAAFLFGVLPYSFVNLVLWIIFDVNKEITKQDIVNTIYRTERIVQHSERIYDAIIDNHAILRIDEYGECFSNLF